MWHKRLRELMAKGGDSFYDLRFFRELDSTNRYIIDEALAGADEGICAFADRQFMGRGRSGRSWNMNPGESLAFSFLLRPKMEFRKITQITPLLGYTVATLFRDMSGADILIKWPNDVVCRGRKICGILTEGGVSGGLIDYAVVGIGININNSYFPDELSDKATSLAICSGREFDIAEVAAGILLHFHENYNKFLEIGDLSFIEKPYNQLLAGRGSAVKIEDQASSYEAICEGIDKQGRLVVTKRDGTRCAVDSGEVSIRGLYGYI